MSTKPRLVIVSGSFPEIPCGVSPYVKRIADLTARRDAYDVNVLTTNDARVDTNAVDNCSVHPRIGRWSVFRAGAICREILRLEPDIVHIQNPTIMYNRLGALTMSRVAPLLKKRAPKLRVVVMQHDIAIGGALGRWRYHPLFRAVDAIFVSNSRDEQAIVAQGIDPARIYRVPFSSYIRLHKPSNETRLRARAALGIPTDARCIAHFGFVQPTRNVDVLIRALQLLSCVGHNIHGLIIGGAFADQQGYYDRCRRFAERVGLAEHITWTGYATELQIADALAAADVFVSLLQRGADMRNTSILTGMLAQLPIVTAENARYYTDPDLRRFGCHCVRPDAPAEVAEGISFVLANPPTRAFLAQRAAFLNPDTVWAHHIDVQFRAYRGQPPIPSPQFAPSQQ